MFSRKKRQLIATIICVILIAAMVVPMAVSYLI